MREYLQILALRAIFDTSHGQMLSFMGGTCLRICYDLKRYSEDLDFALDKPVNNYSFQFLNEQVMRYFRLRGFQLEAKISADKTVQKSFLRFSGLLQAANLAVASDQKLALKLEIDTQPLPVKDNMRESYFVTRFGEIFPLIKHDLPTLFAGKLLAIFSRPYRRGRDFYDLIWYLRQEIAINLDYLAAGLKSIGHLSKKEKLDEKQVLNRLLAIINNIDTDIILRDIKRFLEDTSEHRWLADYKRLSVQLINQRLSPNT
jgi:predicted nucleotidyltransferase component of viral defense system